MRLLIIGVNYAPEKTGIGPYTEGLASYMATRAHSVEVVTGLPSYPEWRVHDPFRRVFWRHEERDDVSVHRRWHYVPKSQSALRRLLYEGTFLLTGASSAFLTKPDLVLGITPSLSGGVLSRLVAERFGVPYALILQDLMGLAASQSGMSGGGRVAQLVTSAEKWVCVRAAAIGIIAEGFRHHLESQGVDPIRIHRVRNWVRIQEPSVDPCSTRTHFGWHDEQIVSLHAGNMGYKQGLDNVLEAARLAQNQGSTHQFVLVGDGNQRMVLERRATELNLRNLQFLPLQSEQAFPNLLAAADILLLNQRAGVSEMALPSKLTSYLASGRPVVAAVEEDSESAKELNDSKAGIVIKPDDPQALVRTLLRLGADAPTRLRLGANGRNHALSVLSANGALSELEKLILGSLKSRISHDLHPT